MNARSTCGGLSASPTDAAETCSCESLCFINASATFNLTLFTATLQFFCKHIYEPSSVLWWSRDSSSRPQPRTTHVSRRELRVRGTAQRVGKKLSKCLSITKQELRRVYTSPHVYQLLPHVLHLSTLFLVQPLQKLLPAIYKLFWLHKADRIAYAVMSHKTVTRE